MQKKRIEWVDALKGFAILTVIYIHNLFPETQAVYFVPAKLISAFHMTLFFMAAGYFFNPFKDIAFVPFLKKKAKALLIPYFVWGVVINFGINFIRSQLGTSINLNIKNTLISALLGKGSGLSSWFLLVLFDIYIIQYVISRLLCKLFHYKKAPVICCTLLVNLGLMAIGYFVTSPVLNLYRLKYAFLTCIFFYCGYLIRLLWETAKSKVPDHLITALVFLTAGVILSFVNGKVSLFNDHFGKPYLTPFVALMINFGLFGVFKQLDKYSGTAIMRGLIYFGQNTIIILLTHKIIILGFRVAENLMHMPDHTLNPVLATVITVLVEIPVIYFCRRFIPATFGKEKMKKEL